MSRALLQHRSLPYRRYTAHHKSPKYEQIFAVFIRILANWVVKYAKSAIFDPNRAYLSGSDLQPFHHFGGERVVKRLRLRHFRAGAPRKKNYRRVFHPQNGGLRWRRKIYDFRTLKNGRVTFT